jgi:putative endopeptidase
MMSLKLKHLTTITAVAFTAGLFSTFTASAQHDSPKSVAGKFIIKKNFNETIPPGDNFFEYANGNWVKENPIPAKESRWGSFGILADKNTKQMLTILNDVSTKPGLPKGSIKQRVGDMYASAMDSVTIDKRGYTPIKTDLQRIAQINSLDGVLNETITDRLTGISGPLYGIGVGQDSKHPSQNAINLFQGGTSLPDRDNYLKDDARSKKIQAAYHDYIVSLFTLTGSSAAEADAAANTVFNIEKQLANAQWSRVAQRDPNKTYNKFSLADFSKKTPHLNWVDITAKLKMGGQDSILVGQPPFFKSLDSLLTVVPVNDWKTYLKWNVLKGSAGSLSAPFVKASFNFSAALSGQQVQAPRNERMAKLVDGSVGELLGQLYVEKYFSPEAKIYMAKLIGNLKIALGDRIKKLDWMSDATKVRALKKLEAFSVKIAYPDKWQTYDGLAINRDDYFGNLKRVSQRR